MTGGGMINLIIAVGIGSIIIRDTTTNEIQCRSAGMTITAH